MTKKPQETATLARFVQLCRQIHSTSQEDLATEAQLPVQMIQDIESGLEQFLSPAIRQKLARALKVLPSQLKKLEKEPTEAEEEAGKWLKKTRLQTRIRNEYHQVPEGTLDLTCPDCESPLIIRSFQREDIEGHTEQTYKVNCTKCLFRMTC